MKIGDSIRVVGVPGGLEGETSHCSGFVLDVCSLIFGIVPVPEINSELLELHVGDVVGEPDYMHSIWIEKAFVTTADLSTKD